SFWQSSSAHVATTGSTRPRPTAQPLWNVQSPHRPQEEQHAVTARFALFSQLVVQQTAAFGADHAARIQRARPPSRSARATLMSTVTPAMTAFSATCTSAYPRSVTSGTRETLRQ